LPGDQTISLLLPVLLIQVLLPICLLGWLAFVPGTSWATLATAAAGTALFLFAMSRVAQWAVTGWWLPNVYWGLFAVAILVQALAVARSGGVPIWPASAGGWAGAVFGLVLIGVGGFYSARVIEAGRVPPGPVVDIENPFLDGHFLVGHGGGIELLNGHLKTLDPEIERFGNWRGQSYAVDFFGTGRWGLRADGLQPADPARYAIFGADLVAPCDGEVIAVENAMPDLRVPETDADRKLGNHVLLRCGDTVIVMAHLRQGSVRVAAGDRVAVGDPVAQVGNSGNSTEPHLHIHAQRQGPPETPLAAEPLWLRIDGRFLVRGDRLRGRQGNAA
jgi:hypothetical protein